MEEVDLELVLTRLQTIDADTKNTTLFEFDSGLHKKSRAERDAGKSNASIETAISTASRRDGIHQIHDPQYSSQGR